MMHALELSALELICSVEAPKWMVYVALGFMLLSAKIRKRGDNLTKVLEIY
jgi:hypothetical protein